MDVDSALPVGKAAADASTGSMVLPSGVIANAPYEGQAPSLPAILVPIFPLEQQSSVSGECFGHSRLSMHGGSGDGAASGGDTGGGGTTTANTASGQRAGRDTAAEPRQGLCPSMANAAVLGLTAVQMGQITGWRCQMAQNSVYGWKYEFRRTAQAVLDFLYLGPSSAARDRVFLQSAGITMLMALRDSRMAMARLMSVDRLAAELGIEACHVDIVDTSQLIQALPGIIHTINDHMLGGGGGGGDGGTDGLASGSAQADYKPATTVPMSSSPRKVFVFCETGNDRSAAVVAAYVMALYAVGVVEAVQFVIQQRFCAFINGDTRHMLRSFGDILAAQSQVANHTSGAAFAPAGARKGEGEGARVSLSVSDRCAPTAAASTSALANEVGQASPHRHSRPSGGPAALASATPSATHLAVAHRPKRKIEETLEAEDERMEDFGMDNVSQSSHSAASPRLNLDMARYQDRQTFMPFVDLSVSDQLRRGTNYYSS